MRSNYKKLWKYIREVNIRNTDLSVTLLLWISIQKIFILSIANIIWTDMMTYKIVKNRQFAYGTVTSRNWDKISIALLENNDEAIVSQAYKVFEVIDENELLPEYLMMWFRRPEFDRYARYMSHWSTREVFDWKEMCDVELPVPNITKQQEIVDEYNAIKNRISLNNSLIEKLEETAQAIYKEWFVDFEFPDENWKPYKSSGGEMEFCSELEKEVPKGWKYEKISELIYFQEWPWIRNWQFTERWINFLNIRCIKESDIDLSICSKISEEEANIKYNHFLLKEFDIIMSTSWTLWKYAIIRNDHLPLCLNTSLIRFKNIYWKSEYSYIFLYLISWEFLNHLTDNATWSAQVNVWPTHIEKLKMLNPNLDIQIKFNENCFSIINKIVQKRKEIKLLQEMKDLILSKIASES